MTISFTDTNTIWFDYALDVGYGVALDLSVKADVNLAYPTKTVLQAVKLAITLGLPLDIDQMDSCYRGTILDAAIKECAARFAAQCKHEAARRAPRETEEEQRARCAKNPICGFHHTNTCPCAESAGMYG